MQSKDYTVKITYGTSSPDRAPAPTDLAPDIAEQQDPNHTEADFLRDLARATTNRSKEKLGRD